MKPEEASLSSVDSLRSFVGDVQSLEENYNEESRQKAAWDPQLQREEFLQNVSTKGHIVHYWQTVLEHRVYNDGYIKYKVNIYRMEDTRNIRSQHRNTYPN